MLSLLVTLLVICVIAAIFFMVIRALPLPAPWNGIAQLIVALILLVVLLQVLLGGLGGISLAR